jgi:hypothetical protein
MRKISIIAATLLAFGTAVVAAEPDGGPAADQPNTPAVPPTSGTSSSELSRSGGVIVPPSGVDPGIKQSPPPSDAKMPVIPPPGTPGGNPSIKPK